MIIIKYTKEHKEEIEGIYEDLKSQARYLGEDGTMVCVADNRNDAMELFKNRLHKDVGGEAVSEVKKETITNGFIFLQTVEKEDRDEVEFYTYWNGYMQSDYPVFIHNPGI